MTHYTKVAVPVAGTASHAPVTVRELAKILFPATLIIIAAYVAARQATTPTLAAWLDNLHWTVAYLAAAVLAWYGVTRADEQSHAPRRWFAYGLTLSAIGQLLWDIQTAVEWTGYPAPSDFFFVSFGPCCVWGLLLTIRNHTSRPLSWSLILDAVTLAVVVLAIVLVLYLPRNTGSSDIQLTMMVAYPISMLSSGCLSLVMVPTLKLKIRPQWLTFVLACTVNGMLWMQWIYWSQTDDVVDNPWLYLMFSLVTLALGVGAARWQISDATSPAWERRADLFLRMLPLLVVGGAAISVGLVWSLHDVPRAAAVAVYVSAALVFVLAAIRQSLLLFERERLLALEQHNGEMQRTFQTLFLITRGGLALLDSHGRFREINPSCCQLLGYTRAELLNMRIHDIDTVQTPHLPGHLGLLDEHGNGTIETLCRHKDGHLLHVELTNALIPDSGGQVFVIFRNITERKLADQQLHLMAQRLAIATRSAGIGIWEYQPPNDTLVWDAQMHQLYGTYPDEFRGSYADWERLMHPDDRERLRQLYLSTLAGEDEYHAEFRIVRPDGSLRHIETWADAQVNTAGIPERLIGVNWDITERKESEATHVRLEAQLRQSQKLEAIGTLASGIAHDFNNILSAILGNIELALQDTHVDNPVQTSMQEIRKAGQRAKELVRRIVAFGKPHDLDFRPSQLSAVVEDAIKLVRATLPATVEIDCRLAAKTPLVLIDSAQIAQVLLNLCTNAYQAMDQQKGRIEISLDVREFNVAAALPSTDLKPGSYVCLHIGDTGTGVDPAIADRIFEPFFTTKAMGEGSGLGLAIVHSIVRSHAGAILLDSERGKGTTFHIYLPAVADAIHCEPEPTVMSHTIAKGAGQHILYVDDEEPLVFLTTRMLERFGYRVSGYTDAEEALQAALADDSDFDLIITDQSMPGMSGTELTKELLRKRPTSRIVLVSGYLPPREIEQARMLGVQEVILKPDTIDDLAAAIHRLLTA